MKVYIVVVRDGNGTEIKKVCDCMPDAKRWINEQYDDTGLKETWTERRNRLLTSRVVAWTSEEKEGDLEFISIEIHEVNLPLKVTIGE